MYPPSQQSNAATWLPNIPQQISLDLSSLSPSYRSNFLDYSGAAVDGRAGPQIHERQHRPSLHFDVSEIQAPICARKYANVDRRPLDPPPTVLLKVYRVHEDYCGTKQYEEVHPDAHQLLTYMCHVQLFPADRNHGQEDQDLSRHLAGEQCVQAVSIRWPTEGDPKIMFVFSDLSVRAEGRFRLAYRFFDIHSHPAGDNFPIQARNLGQEFRVYSTKEFPGLTSSTALTKGLAIQGVRVNLRDEPRRRKKD